MAKSGKAPFVSRHDLNMTIGHLKGLNSKRNTCILLFSHFLGLRAKELATLRVGDVFDINQRKVKETIRLLRHMTKGNKYREVFLLDDTVRDLLYEYIMYERCMIEDAPLFLSQKGGAFSPNTMQRMIANCYKQAGIKASSHSGRRSFATNLIMQNVDIYAIKQLMGHSSIMTTQEYFSSDPNHLRSAIRKLSF